MASASFLKKSAFLGSGIAVKLVVGLVAVRISAQLLGPENFGMTGQIAGIISIVTLLAGGGLTNGVSKIYAGTEIPEEKRREWVDQASILAFTYSLIVLLALAAAAPIVKAFVLDGHPQSYLLIGSIAGFALIVASASVPQGKINGLHRDDLYAASLVSGSVIGLGGLAGFVWLLGPTGVYVGIVWMPAAQYLVLYLIGRRVDKNRNFKIQSFKLNEKSIYFFKYGVLSVTTGLIIPTSYILLRSVVSDGRSAEYLGFWQANIRISEAYLQLPMMLLTVVFFARFASQASESIDLRKVGAVYLQFSSLLGVIFFVVYVTRDFWVTLVFSERFREMTNFLSLQLVGDFFRINSYIGTTLLAARGYIRIPIACELFQGLLLATTGLLFVKIGLHRDIYLAYVFTYFLYFCLTIFLVFRAAKVSQFK